MAEENVLHWCITKFMLDTCHFTKNKDYAAMNIAINAYGSIGGLQCNGYDWSVLCSGSSSEFNIKPMLSCIGDIDVMVVANHGLAVPHGYTLPTELPHCYKRNVTYMLYKMIDSHKPGYVYLQPSCIVRINDNGRCIVQHFENNKAASAVLLPSCRPQGIELPINVTLSDDELTKQYYSQDVINNSFIQSFSNYVVSKGPAMKLPYSKKVTETYITAGEHLCFSTVDIVTSLRSPIWSPLAAEWPTRKRNHNWPDQATINLIVNNACDVVNAVHPSCSQDKWMNEYQWRVSFSRAELTLLNSWTQLQQIVYHMLRFVLKREVFSETKITHPDLTQPSNYHIKTLTLWECEQKPLRWWSSEFSLIEICCLLLHKLSDWVANKICQHYFISKCNLMDNIVDEISQTVSNKVRSLADVSILASWFFDNYVRECAQCCPENVSKLFEDFYLNDELENAMHAIIDWKLSNRLQERWDGDYEYEKMMMSFHELLNMDGIRAFVVGVKESPNFDPRLRDYFIATWSLRVAYTISIHALNEELLEVLWTLFGPCVVDTSTDTTGIGPQCERAVSTRKATSLAALSTVRSDTLEMLHNEMSKAYLYQTFANKQVPDLVVHILLAALNYKSGQYWEAINHCKQVLNERNRENYRLCDIEVECLLQLDKSVDSVFGVIQLYQYVKQTTLHLMLEHQPESKLAITSQLFVHYLHLICSSVADAKVHLAKYRCHLFAATQPLLSDVLLFKALEMQLGNCTRIRDAPCVNNDVGNNFSCCMDTSLLVTMVQLVTLEKLIKFRESTVHKVHSDQFPVLNEFELLHACSQNVWRCVKIISKCCFVLVAYEINFLS